VAELHHLGGRGRQRTGLRGEQDEGGGAESEGHGLTS